MIHHPLVQNNEYDHKATHEDVSSLSQKYLYPEILLEPMGRNDRSIYSLDCNGQLYLR